MKRLFNIKNNNGFGMLGIVMTIALISGTAGIILVTNTSSLEGKQKTQTFEKMDLLVAAIQKFQNTNGGTDPGDLDDLVFDNNPACREQCNGCVACTACALDNTPANPTYLTMQGWCGPYIDQPTQEDLLDFKTDGWGNTIAYDSAANTITSFGPNRTDNSGGGDDIQLSF